MKFLWRWFWRGLITLVVLLSLLVGGLSAYDWIVRKNFYDGHPLLRTMLEVPREGMDAVLMRAVPIGTSRTDAIRTLDTSNLRCKPLAGTLHKDDMLLCIPDDRPSSIPRWYVELTFDPEDRVVSGRAFTGKATK